MELRKDKESKADNKTKVFFAVQPWGGNGVEIPRARDCGCVWEGGKDWNVHGETDSQVTDLASSLVYALR